jgi:hypothetical protein
VPEVRAEEISMDSIFPAVEIPQEAKGLAGKPEGLRLRLLTYLDGRAK